MPLWCKGKVGVIVTLIIGGARHFLIRLSRQDHRKSWVCTTKSKATSEFQDFSYVLVNRRFENYGKRVEESPTVILSILILYLLLLIMTYID